MTSVEQVYAEFVEPRSFGCKRCGYTSTNRRVVEQHLRTDHPELFGEDLSPSPSPARGGEQLGRAVQDLALAQPTPPPRTGEGVGGRGQVTLYTDAGTWENGTARQRSVLAVWDSRTQGIILDEDLPGTTNNEAEYAAIIAALERAREDGLTDVLLRSDSQLCVNQINGTWQIKEERLRPLRERAARLLRTVRGRIEWVPRGRNQAGIYLEKKYKR